MESLKHIDYKWLLVEWKTGGSEVVFVKTILKPLDKEPVIGEPLTLCRKGEPEIATLIARASERVILEAMMKKKEPVAGPSKEPQYDEEEEGEDFCSSASSWSPGDEEEQSDESAKANKIHYKKRNLERYKRQYSNRSSKKVLTPSNKENVIVENNAEKPHTNKEQNECKIIEKPDEPKEPETIMAKKTKKLKRSAKTVRHSLQQFFRVIEDLKKPLHVRISEAFSAFPFENIGPNNNAEETDNKTEDEPRASENDLKENVRSDTEEFNRSDDNVLISNKYANAGVKTETVPQPQEEPMEEWIPIGSGKTLIHIDQFKKINMKSYTVATRGLLMAVFPRKVLATHSLTGKCSPAFLNKPAKMCLDPKKVCDIILEVMDRFHVKENLVRSIITTKCADESKMWKTRHNKSIVKKEPNITK